MNSKLVISIALCVILLSSSLAYAEEGVDFFTWLWGLFGSQEPAVSVQGNQAQAGGSCSQQCDQDCNLEKCVNQDGCLWNKGNCDNICTPGMAKEVVVIKRYEGCSNAANCNDVYLCENGVTGNPINVAFSTVSKLLDSTGIVYIGSNIDDSFLFDANNYLSSIDTVDTDISDVATTDYVPTSSGTVSCSNIPASFVAGYNQYSTIIKNAADNYLRSSGIDNPEALIAGIISQESAWKPTAVSQCSSAGIAQFIEGTAIAYGLNVPVTGQPGGYTWAYCRIGTNKCLLKNKAGVVVETKVASCNSCTPNNCMYNQDERFNPEKSIDAMARHISDLMGTSKDGCNGDLDGAIRKYNSGNCASEANKNYFSTVKNYYMKWKSCLSSQSTTQSGGVSSQANTDSVYLDQPCTSPEGLTGTCQYATASGCTFDSTHSCGPTSTVKCCVPDSTFIGQSCTAYGARGTCAYVGTSGCTFPYAGLCHGTTDVKCCFSTVSITGRSTYSVTGMDTAFVATDLTSLDASLNQQSSVLQEGQYTVSEKINIQNNEGDFIYTDESGNTITPQCNIDPINTGVRDYWIGLETSSDVCIGMHSVEQVATTDRFVDLNEIRNLYTNINVDTPVTVKDPYMPELASTSIIGIAELPNVRGQDYYDYYDSSTTNNILPITENILPTTAAEVSALENTLPTTTTETSSPVVTFSKEELMGMEAPMSASLVSINDLCPLNTNIVTGADTTTCDTIKLRPEVLAAFNKMKDAANADGITLFVLSGYRSFQTQKQIWNNKFTGLQGSDATRIAKIAEFSAVPGLSRHHWGTEIDLDSLNQTDFVGNGKYANVYTWLKNNAANFGFCQPYNEDRVVKTEPWHWSYKPLSSQFTNQHMSTITAADISGQGISGAGAIASEFDYYHSGFVDNVNPNCLT